MEGSSEVPANVRAVLVVWDGPRRNEAIPLSGEPVVLGSAPEADVVLADASVAPRHARVQHRFGQWEIEDLGSAAGTFLENIRLAPGVPTPLPFGATLALGRVRLHFRPPPQAEERPLTPPSSVAQGPVPALLWWGLALVFALAVVTWLLWARR